MEVIRKGNNFYYVYEGYIYMNKKKQGSGRLFMSCIRHRSVTYPKCFGSMSWTRGQVPSVGQLHNHPSPDDRIEEIRLRARIAELAFQAEFNTFSDIYKSIKEDFPEKTTNFVIPHKGALRQSAHRYKKQFKSKVTRSEEVLNTELDKSKDRNNGDEVKRHNGKVEEFTQNKENTRNDSYQQQPIQLAQRQTLSVRKDLFEGTDHFRINAGTFINLVDDKTNSEEFSDVQEWTKMSEGFSQLKSSTHQFSNNLNAMKDIYEDDTKNCDNIDKSPRIVQITEEPKDLEVAEEISYSARTRSTEKQMQLSEHQTSVDFLQNTSMEDFHAYNNFEYADEFICPEATLIFQNLCLIEYLRQNGVKD